MTGSLPLHTADIRPEDLRAEQAERFAADVAWLLEHREEFDHRPCPACGDDVPTAAFAKAGLEYVRCAGCRTLYVDPRPSVDLLHRYYTRSENYQFWAEHVFPASEAVRRERIFRPRVERVLDLCERHGVRPDVVIEVGAGFGIFCEELMATGRVGRVLGLEPTPHLAERCRSLGIEVIEAPVESVDLAEFPPPAVIASFETIEHLHDPRAFVEACAAVLRPGGLLVLTCPSGDGFDVVEMGPVSGTVDAEHLNYFTPVSLAAMVAACGLEVIEVSTPGELDAELVREEILAGTHDPSPFLRQLLIDRWEDLGAPFQKFLAEHGLSSHLWLTARRP
jgi:SAM-dependent methyltransferase